MKLLKTFFVMVTCMISDCMRGSALDDRLNLQPAVKQLYKYTSICKREAYTILGFLAGLLKLKKFDGRKPA